MTQVEATVASYSLRLSATNKPPKLLSLVPEEAASCLTSQIASMNCSLVFVAPWQMDFGLVFGKENDGRFAKSEEDVAAIEVIVVVLIFWQYVWIF